MHVLAGIQIAGETQRALKQFGNRHSSRRNLHGAGERQQRVDERGEAIGFVGDEGTRATSVGIVAGHSIAQVLCGGSNHGQRIAHFVRDRGGELSKRCQLFVLNQLRARRIDRFDLIANQSSGLPLAPAPIDGVAEQIAKDRERYAKPRRG